MYVSTRVSQLLKIRLVGGPCSNRIFDNPLADLLVTVLHSSANAFTVRTTRRVVGKLENLCRCDHFLQQSLRNRNSMDLACLKYFFLTNHRVMMMCRRTRSNLRRAFLRTSAIPLTVANLYVLHSPYQIGLSVSRTPFAWLIKGLLSVRTCDASTLVTHCCNDFKLRSHCTTVNLAHIFDDIEPYRFRVSGYLDLSRSPDCLYLCTETRAVRSCCIQTSPHPFIYIILCRMVTSYWDGCVASREMTASIIEHFPTGCSHDIEQRGNESSASNSAGVGSGIVAARKWTGHWRPGWIHSFGAMFGWRVQ